MVMDGSKGHRKLCTNIVQYHHLNVRVLSECKGYTSRAGVIQYIMTLVGSTTRSGNHLKLIQYRAKLLEDICTGQHQHFPMVPSLICTNCVHLQTHTISS